VSGGRAPRLTLALSAGELPIPGVHESTVAVIDVLRATSVLPQAFASGALRVIPTDSVESATGLAASLDRSSTLICGEREGKKIAGFDLGNSPEEYVPEIVVGKTLVFCSTNGSRAMIRCLAAPEQIVASFVNVSAAVRRLCLSERNLIVVCAGDSGRACLEDTVMGGLLVERLLEARPGLVLDDRAVMARELWRRWEDDLPRLLRTADHGVYLVSLGFERDLDFCSRMDLLETVPVLVDGRIEVDQPQPSR
jgi:2-phosphosulfolactate phosphatase